jgi:hypothetical protein
MGCRKRRTEDSSGNGTRRTHRLLARHAVDAPLVTCPRGLGSGGIAVDIVREQIALGHPEEAVASPGRA